MNPRRHWTITGWGNILNKNTRVREVCHKSDHSDFTSALLQHCLVASAPCVRLPNCDLQSAQEAFAIAHFIHPSLYSSTLPPPLFPFLHPKLRWRAERIDEETTPTSSTRIENKNSARLICLKPYIGPLMAVLLVMRRVCFVMQATVADVAEIITSHTNLL